MEITVLVVDPERDFAEEIVAVLDQNTEHEHRIHACATLDSALRLASHYNPDVIFIGERYGERMLKAMISALKMECPRTINILLTAVDGCVAGTHALALGAHDYLCRAHLDRDALHRTSSNVWLHKWRHKRSHTDFGATLPAPASATLPPRLER